MKNPITHRALPLAIGTATLAMGMAAHAQDAQIDRKVAELMKKMTVAEKVGQLHQLSGRQFTGPTAALMRTSWPISAPVKSAPC